MGCGARPRARGHRARPKSDGPTRGDDHGAPLTLEGDAAAEALEEERRRTTSRRELSRKADFDDLSPDVGEIDDRALADLAAEDLDAVLDLLAEMAGATDRRLAALAARVAGRLVLDVARSGPVSARGLGRMASLPADRAEGDLDIDRSLDGILEARAGGRRAAIDDLLVRTWRRPATALALVIDRSGSMNGHRLATAAVAAAAMSWRAPRDWSVLAFGERVLAVKSQDRHRAPGEVVDDVLRLRGHGTTDLAGALASAAAQLERSNAKRRVTLLLSDCRATAGADASVVARRLDELCILAPHDDAADARTFASTVGARITTLAGPSDVPAALSQLL